MLKIVSSVSAVGLPLILSLSVFALSGCNQPATAQAPSGQAMAMPVPVVKVKAQDLSLSWEYPAQVSGYREVEIRPRVSGIIEKRRFEEGDKVKAGQSLFLLDTAPYETALARAKADQKAAEVRLAQTQRDLTRIQPLLESKAVSQLEVDSAQSNVELAAANLAVAKAQVKQAALNLTYAQVKSPVSGFVGRAQRDIGALVSGPQDLLTSVTQVDKVYLNFGIPQKDRQQMQASDGLVIEGGKLAIEVLGQDGQPIGLSSTLDFQDVKVNPSTGTVDARTLIQNRKMPLLPGQFVRVRVSGATQLGAITLPQRAVLQNPMGGKIVMTVTPDNTVAPRPVQVAQWEGDQWVITGGLQDGDVVMTDGFVKAQPGSKVTPLLDGKPLGSGAAPVQAGEATQPQAKP